MMHTMKFIHHLKTITVLLFLFWFGVSGCLIRSSSGPPPLLPNIPINTSTSSLTPAPTLTPTPTHGLIALPLIMQAEPQTSPSIEIVSTPTLTPTVTVVPTETPTPAPPPQITLLFTGVIVPARCVQSAIDARGDDDYIYDEWRETISSADLAVGTLNTSLSDLSNHP